VLEVNGSGAGVEELFMIGHGGPGQSKNPAEHGPAESEIDLASYTAFEACRDREARSIFDTTLSNSSTSASLILPAAR